MSSLPTTKTKGHKFRSWFFGILLLAGVIAAVTHIGEIEHFAKLAREARPRWLLVALILQFGTYVCTAAVWKRALYYVNIRQSFFSFLPLAFAKLFADQALPSGGASGISFFIAALKRRGVPTELCMAMMLVSLVAYYMAYLIVALASLALLWFLAMGQNVSFLVAFPSFVVSSIIATLSPIPLGLGIFEASSTGMLSALGIPVEAALTSTLLLRGFTLWLPMLPGLWLARRQLR